MIFKFPCIIAKGIDPSHYKPVFVLYLLVHRKDFLLVSSETAAKAVILILLVVIEKIHIYVTTEALGTAIVQFAFCSLRHVLIPPLLSFFLSEMRYEGEKA